VLVNVVTLDKADEQTFLKTWQDDAAFMKRQPGFISTQLHRALGESPTYLNYAVWESTAHYRAAFGHPEFRAKLSTHPSSVVASPHLFQKVAVPTSASHNLRPTVGIGACGIRTTGNMPGWPHRAADAARYCRRCHRVSERAGNCCVARKAAIGPSRRIHYLAHVRSWWKQTRGMEGVRRF
jgi:heme-degrading monooxygenase HmoA